MIHYVSYIKGLLAGIILGALAIVGAIVYLILKVKEDNHTLDAKDETMSTKIPSTWNEKEGDLSSEELSLIREAVEYLNRLDSTFQVIHDNPETFGYSGGKSHSFRISMIYIRLIM